jgi:hypothetical protein
MKRSSNQRAWASFLYGAELMCRMTNARTAITLANRLGGYVFGGYVRDYWAGDSFKDVDIYLPTHIPRMRNHIEARTCWERAIAGYGCINLLNSKGIYNSWLTRSTYSFTGSMPSKDEILIDIVTSDDPYPYKMGMDVDVNYVWMSGLSGIEIIPGMGLDADTIFRHIKNHEYDITVDPGLNGKCGKQTPQHRIDHIEARGYTRAVDSKYKDRFVASSTITKSSVCQECNGKGELDFFFYKRLCGCKLK